MGGFVRIVGAAGMVLAPVCFGIADEMQLVAVNNDNQVGLSTGWGEAQAVAQTQSVAAHLTLFQAASWLFLAGALLTIPAALAIWRLTVRRSPAWAWAGAALAILAVMGQIAHLVLNYGLQQAYATGFDPGMGYQLDQMLQSQLFIDAMFGPFLFTMIAPVVQAIGLRRARVNPLWAVAAAVAFAGVAIVLGSSTWSTVLYTVLWLAAWSPAILATLRDMDLVGAQRDGVPAPAH
jgi:drug/metabolite transporter (DMT)-like permease